MISGMRLALNAAKCASERQMRGNLFSLSDRQQQIYTIDQMFSSFLSRATIKRSSLSITIPPHHPRGGGYARQRVSYSRALSARKNIHAADLRKSAFAKSANFCLFRERKNERVEKIRVRVSRTERSSSRLALSFVVPAFCSLQSDIASHRRRIMSIR